MNRQNAKGWFVATVACLAIALASSLAADEWVVNARADMSVRVERPTSLSGFDPLVIEVDLPGMGDDLKVTSFVQRFPINPHYFRTLSQRLLLQF